MTFQDRIARERQRKDREPILCCLETVVAELWRAVEPVAA
jgi:hypothetical protein